MRPTKKRTLHATTTRTPAQIRQLKQSWIRWMGQKKFDLFITLNYNNDATYGRLRSTLKGLLARLDRLFLGRDWCHFPTAQRTKAVAVVEHLDTNPHLHVLMTLPTSGRKLPVSEIRRLVEDIWRILVHAGSVNVKSIEEVTGLVRYFAKEFRRPGYFEKFIIASEFHTADLVK